MNSKKEWRIVLRSGGKSETLLTLVSDREDAVEKMVSLYWERFPDKDAAVHAPGGRRIGTASEYLEVIPTGLFELESNVPVEVIVDKEEDPGRYPIQIQKDDVIINPVEYDFRNRIDPRRNLNAQDIKEILGTLETVSFWGSTILSRLNKIEAEIFSDVLRDVAEVLETVDKKNPK